MERSNDWIVPRMNSIVHFHKPPATFWLVGASLKLFGESELAGRFPVAAASFLTLLLTAMWARRESDRQTAALTALILVTSVEYWFLSRLVLTDMFLTLSVTGAFFFAWRAARDKARGWWIGFWLSLSFSFLVKGPVGMVMVLPVLVAHSMWAGDKRSWNLRPGWGIPMFLVLVVPWPWCVLDFPVC